MTNGKAIIILNSLKQYYNDKNEDSYVGFDDEDNEAIDMAIKALEQTKWIPTSEKLPEDYIHVLCQFTLGGMGECYLAHGLFHIVGGVRLSHDEIIAWMSLPHSYKLESEDEE